jgi:hypothetical protein
MNIRLEILEDLQSPLIDDIILAQKKLLPGYVWNPCNMIKIRFDGKADQI